MKKTNKWHATIKPNKIKHKKSESKETTKHNNKYIKIENKQIETSRQQNTISAY